jgi:hypothetical protein
MSDIPVELRSLVLRRAGERCEYCQLSQVGQEATFHIDHVIPRASAGPTTPENLALACVSCSLRKGARLAAIDPLTNLEVPLFHPRQHAWRDHFRWTGPVAEGLTPTGRATIATLAMNRPLIIEIREHEMRLGRHPRPDEGANGHRD